MFRRCGGSASALLVKVLIHWGAEQLMQSQEKCGRKIYVSEIGGRWTLFVCWSLQHQLNIKAVDSCQHVFEYACFNYKLNSFGFISDTLCILEELF